MFENLSPLYCCTKIQSKNYKVNIEYKFIPTFKRFTFYYFIISTYCNLRKAKPIETANSGPVASKTLSKKAGDPTFEKGCPISTPI